MNTYCGTPLNMAPEIMHKRTYNYKADIWSIGVLTYNLITGTYPFFASSKDELLKKVEKGNYQIS